MGKIVDAFVSLSFIFAVSAGGNLAAKKTFRFVQKLTLEKVEQGLPPLPKFKKK